ncbi:MAG: adenylosuccinate lyase [Halodesulfurarchaeum sp.]
MTADRGPLWAVSPLDGRYADRTAPLKEYASEAALMRGRIQVEVEYVIALADLDAIALEVSSAERASLRSCYEGFNGEDADLIKRIETEGARGYAATNHDVKAIEYFLREHAPERVHPWLHFGLTSEDVTNLAYRLLIRGAVREVLLPRLRSVRETLIELANDYAEVAMLAHTHGQPATPTTFGKEMAVYGDRLATTIHDVESAEGELLGKLGGASGTFAAHEIAVPEVDWPAFASEFVEGLGFEYARLTTQINPGEDLARLFHAISRTNQVLLDLDRDAWEYVSRGYLGQEAVEGETGSSTMPHKVNPIDFENSEGNLSRANSDLQFLADSITTSRLQRDLSDSTVKRNIGTALAHSLLGVLKLDTGLSKVLPRESVMRADLEDNPAVIGEAIQTVLRREGHPDAYEVVKAATRGEALTLEDVHALLDDIDLPEETASRLRALRPADYHGLAIELARSLE